MPTKFEYSIESVLVTSSSGQELEIKDLIVGVDFYESLSSPYIKCELSVIDAAGLIEALPIVGQEKIKLIIKDLNVNKIINREFYVASLSNYIKGNGQAAIYILKLVTPEYMFNGLNLVSQAFAGTFDETLKKITKDYLSTTLKVNEKTNGEYKVIIPNWNPYKAIDWLIKRSINSKGYPFVFYDTLINGINLESYEYIFNKKIYNKFVNRDNTALKDDASNKGAMMNAALQYEIVEMANTGKNILRGSFGQGMHVIDHSKRSYKFVKYDYLKDFKKRDRITQFPFINENFKIKEKSLSEYDSIHDIGFKNELAFNSEQLNNYSNKIEFTKLETDPFIYQLGMIKINMTVKGRSDLSVGNVIYFEVPKNNPTVHNTNKIDNEYLSGKYIVQNVHHKMEQGKYYIIMDLVKESLSKKV